MRVFNEFQAPSRVMREGVSDRDKGYVASVG